MENNDQIVNAFEKIGDGAKMLHRSVKIAIVVEFW